MNDVYYIPGLGADERLFEFQTRYLKGFQIEWPQDLGDNLSSLAKKIIDLNAIGDSATIVGFSFGGQIAKEIKLINPNVKAVMISGVRDSHQLSKAFIRQAKISKYIPDRYLKWAMQTFGPHHASQNDRVSHYQFHLLKQMANDIDPKFFKKTLQLCALWDNNKSCDMLQINGENDIVIPYDKDKSDLVIPNAGHLIVYTHPQIIAKGIEEYVSKN